MKTFLLCQVPSECSYGSKRKMLGIIVDLLIIVDLENHEEYVVFLWIMASSDHRMRRSDFFRWTTDDLRSQQPRVDDVLSLLSAMFLFIRTAIIQPNSLEDGKYE